MIGNKRIVSYSRCVVLNLSMAIISQCCRGGTIIHYFTYDIDKHIKRQLICELLLYCTLMNVYYAVLFHRAPNYQWYQSIYGFNLYGTPIDMNWTRFFS